MKRDNDYLRDLLIEFEAHEGWFILVSHTSDMSPDDHKEFYHVHLLCDAGLMTPISKSGYRMTNDGHDYLATIRDEGIWKKTKEGAAKIGGATLDIMKDIALAYVKKEAAEKLGITL